MTADRAAQRAQGWTFWEGPFVPLPTTLMEPATYFCYASARGPSWLG